MDNNDVEENQEEFICPEIGITCLIANDNHF